MSKIFNQLAYCIQGSLHATNYATSSWQYLVVMQGSKANAEGKVLVAAGSDPLSLMMDQGDGNNGVGDSFTPSNPQFWLDTVPSSVSNAEEGTGMEDAVVVDAAEQQEEEEDEEEGSLAITNTAVFANIASEWQSIRSERQTSF